MTASTLRRTARRRLRRREHGQETLQGIMVMAFVLLPVLVAIFTFGSMIHTEIAVQAAAASGARSAGSAGEFSQTQYAKVVSELDANDVDATVCAVSADRPAVALGEPLTVTVSCPQHIGIPFLLDENVDLHSSFTAFGEVNR